MDFLAVLLLIASAVFAALKAFGGTARSVDFGWLAIACLITGAFLLPALAART